MNIDGKLAIQILYEGAQEVLGNPCLQEVKNWYASSSSKLPSKYESTNFLLALEEMFGVSAGHGLALRIGRASFLYGLKHLGSQVGLKSQEYRLLPAPQRITTGLRVLANVVGDVFGDEVVLSDEEKYWQWRVVNAHGTDPAAECFLKIGLLQEFTSWAGGGRYYPVTRTECRSTGKPACIYRIDKRPLD